MNNFEFFNPVKIIFGKGQIANLAQAIDKNKKIMMVYGGGSIKKNGIYEQVKSALSDYQVIEFGGISANPQYNQLMEAVEVARNEDIDYLLAVGGGSVIDGTKFISAAVNFAGDPWNILAKREKFSNTIPFGTVLTLAATGSEMNCFSVVSRGQDKLGFGHPSLFPEFSILDPEVTYSLPEKQLGNGIVDAFVHVLEQYLTYDVNSPLQDRFAQAILKTLLEEGPKVIHVKDDYASRANFMWSATMALNGLIGSGVIHDWATHMIGHELTAKYGIDHARTLAVVLPSLLRVQKDKKLNKLDQMAREVFNLKDGTPESRAEEAILMIEDFFNSMGVPTKLGIYKVTEDEIPSIVDSLRSHIGANLGEHGDLDQTKVSEILRMAL
jgi:NADP-dependent alcohol dehydrogenase